jgi:large subunit ribosomal protein L21e
MPKSHGPRRKSRYKLKKSARERGLSPISKAIQEFTTGQSVHIDIDPSIHKGMPHPKFHGRTAKVVGQRGRAYLLEVREGDALKQIAVSPQHLKLQK